MKRRQRTHESGANSDGVVDKRGSFDDGSLEHQTMTAMEKKKRAAPEKKPRPVQVYLDAKTKPTSINRGDHSHCAAVLRQNSSRSAPTSHKHSPTMLLKKSQREQSSGSAPGTMSAVSIAYMATNISKLYNKTPCRTHHCSRRP